MEPTSLLPSFLKRKLEGHQSLVKVINNSGWLVLDKLLRGVITLMVGAWVARYLGPEQFGQLAYVLAYLAFFQVVANLGMDGIIVRDIAQIQAKHNIKNSMLNVELNSPNASLNMQHLMSTEIGTILGTAFTMRLIAGVGCWLLAIVGIGFTEGWQSQLLWLTVLAGGMLIFEAADTIDLWFQSQSQSKRTVWAKFIAHLVANGLKVVLILGKFPLVYFAGVMFVELAISAVALGYVYRQFPCGAAWHKSIKEQGKALIRQSWPYIFSGISIVIYMRIDQIMIKNMLGEKELGIYSSVMPFVMMWYLFPSIICLSVAPILSKTYVMDKNTYDQRLIKLFRILLLSSLGICLFMVSISKPITNLLLGDKYPGSHIVLSILIFTSIPVFLGVGQGNWILNNNKQTLFLKQTIAGAIASIIFNYMLIPKYGVNGAALSAIISCFISALFINFVIQKDLFFFQIGVNKSG